MGFLVDDRMDTRYPLALWAAAWLCVVKAILWSVVDTDVINHLVLAKYLVFMVLWIFMAYQISRTRRIAFFGIIALSVVDMVFTFTVPEAFVVTEAMKDNIMGSRLTFIAMLCSTYLSSMMLLAMVPWLDPLTRVSQSVDNPK